MPGSSFGVASNGRWPSCPQTSAHRNYFSQVLSTDNKVPDSPTSNEQILAGKPLVSLSKVQRPCSISLKSSVKRRRKTTAGRHFRRRRKGVDFSTPCNSYDSASLVNVQSAGIIQTNGGFFPPCGMGVAEARAQTRTVHAVELTCRIYHDINTIVNRKLAKLSEARVR